MTEKKVVVRNQAGIHFRPATLIVNLAQTFASEISIINEASNEHMNAKSILNIVSLCAYFNTVLLIRATGPDEVEAVEAIFDLFERRFAED